MALWKWVRSKIKATNSKSQEPDKVLPEEKGAVTLEAIKEKLKDIDDIKYKQANFSGKQVTIIYLSSLVEDKILRMLVMDPLSSTEAKNKKPEDVIANCQTLKHNELPKLIDRIMNGDTIILYPQLDPILAVSTYSVPQRSITTSESETTVIGPQDSFIESLETNISLIKRRIKNPNLKSRDFIIGTETSSKEFRSCYLSVK